MRLPRIKDLTEDQKRVYLYAPSDKHVLVHGPPGTGKTLIACLRAIELQKKGFPVILGMFNKVLSHYSSNIGNGSEMPTQTVLTWFREWWKSCPLPPHPATRVIAINVPFEQKDLVKNAGATWHPNDYQPWSHKKGVWVVDPELYFKDPSSFSSWRLYHEPPTTNDNPNCIDWEEVSRHVIVHEDMLPDNKLGLGTFLIDEGQDFPEGFYRFLGNLSILATSPNRSIAHPLKCFVLADENQQLTEENSTLDQIAATLRIPAENRYLLLDNFRNSKEIAELARHFFADVGALPRLPERSSEKPVYTVAGNQSGVLERITNWLSNNPHKEVGILVFDDSKRSSIAEAIQNAIARIRGRDIKVQTYSWRSRRVNPAESLIFDTPDVVTVLNMQSCKGLEFDAVFIVDLHEAQIGLYGPDRFKMQMFVAVSRGREWVNLIDSGPLAGSNKAHDCLPGEEFLDREHFGNHPVQRRQVASHQRKDLPKHDHGAPVGAKAPLAASWESEFMKLAQKEGLKYNDLRFKDGALWVDGGQKLATYLEPLGFHYSNKRSAWWRK